MTGGTVEELLQVTRPMRIVRAGIARLDELEPLFKAMHEHHRAGQLER